MNGVVELRDAVKIRTAMEQYQDSVYMNMMRKINTECQYIFSEDLETQFVYNCGRDIAGEVVRSCFNTTDYNITVDQLAQRLLTFTYEDEFDPLSNNNLKEQSIKNVFSQKDQENREFSKKQFEKIGVTLPMNDIEYITQQLVDATMTPLFEKETYTDQNGKVKKRYEDYYMIKKGKDSYAENAEQKNGNIIDGYTGHEGDYRFDKNGVKYRNQEVDHDQAVATGKYNKYMKEEGVEKLKQFYNSPDNFAMMYKKANESKGDVRVYDKEGNDITHRASPSQIANEVCKRWETAGSEETREDLKKYGYLDDDGKVPKSVRKKLEDNIRHSQNVESKVILENMDYRAVENDAIEMTKKSIGKIIAGQIIYYSAPPIMYEVRLILKDKNISIDNALIKFEQSAKRVGKYLFSKLKYIFTDIAVNSLKKFIKSFMDILICVVKATVKRLLKITKSLVLSTVDAVRIIGDKTATKSQKANAVFNLYAVTITSCVIEVLFELASDALHIPEPLDDIIFGPLQMITTVVCTNLTLLILKKADLFDVGIGFKTSQIRNLFSESRKELSEEYERSQYLAEKEINAIIESAKSQSREIYDNLLEFEPHKDSARNDLEKINQLFSMDISFESEWLKFIGISV